MLQDYASPEKETEEEIQDDLQEEVQQEFEYDPMSLSVSSALRDVSCQTPTWSSHIIQTLPSKRTKGKLKCTFCFLQEHGKTT